MDGPLRSEFADLLSHYPITSCDCRCRSIVTEAASIVGPAQCRDIRSASTSDLTSYRVPMATRRSESEIPASSLGAEANTKSRNLNRKQLLTSPVDGIVQDLAIHSVGGVVTSAQELMEIVPGNQTLKRESWLENQDIGLIETAQPSEIKIHIFPFTQYGHHRWGDRKNLCRRHRRRTTWVGADLSNHCVHA